MVVTDVIDTKDSTSEGIEQSDNATHEAESIPIMTTADVVDSNNKSFVNMALADVEMVEQPPILSQ